MGLNPKDALFDGPKLYGFQLDPENVTIIGFDTKHGKEHFLYDGDRLKKSKPSKEMIANVMVVGVKTPIIIRKVDGIPLVVNGRRRTRALREANKILIARGDHPWRIPCVVERGEEAKSMVTVASTNTFYVEDEPIDKARRALLMLDKGLTIADIAMSYGVTQQSIRNWVAVLSMVPEVVDAVENGLVPWSIALELKNVSREEQAEKIKELISAASEQPKGKITRSDARKAAGKSGIQKPGKRVLQRVTEAGKDVFSEREMLLLQWVLGEVDGESVEWLHDLIKTKKSKKGKRDENNGQEEQERDFEESGSRGSVGSPGQESGDHRAGHRERASEEQEDQGQVHSQPDDPELVS